MGTSGPRCFGFLNDLLPSTLNRRPVDNYACTCNLKPERSRPPIRCKITVTENHFTVTVTVTPSPWADRPAPSRDSVNGTPGTRATWSPWQAATPPEPGCCRSTSTVIVCTVYTQQAGPGPLAARRRGRCRGHRASDCCRVSSLLRLTRISSEFQCATLRLALTTLSFCHPERRRIRGTVTVTVTVTVTGGPGD